MGVHYTAAIIAAAVFVLINLRFVHIGDGRDWLIVTSLLSLYCWWCYRYSLYESGYRKAAHWSLVVVASLIGTGFASWMVYLFFDFFKVDPTNDNWILAGKVVLAQVLFTLVAFVGLGLAVIRRKPAGRGRKLRRVAFSAAVLVPLYTAITIPSHVRFLERVMQVDAVVSEALVPTESYALGMGDPYAWLGDVFEAFETLRFGMNAVLMTPYFLLIAHFATVRRAGRRRSASPPPLPASPPPLP